MTPAIFSNIGFELSIPRYLMAASRASNYFNADNPSKVTPIVYASEASDASKDRCAGGASNPKRGGL
jgi:hypothetical protein